MSAEEASEFLAEIMSEYRNSGLTLSAVTVWRARHGFGWPDAVELAGTVWHAVADPRSAFATYIADGHVDLLDTMHLQETLGVWRTQSNPALREYNES